MSALISTFGIDWHLLLAQGANFIILAGLLTWLLYKPVLKIVAERQAAVTQGVIDAERAAEKLKAADGVAAERVQKAEDDADGIVASARRAATEEKTRLMKDAEARAAAIAKDADERAKEAVERARRESERDIARLALLAAEKVLKEKS